MRSGFVQNSALQAAWDTSVARITIYVDPNLPLCQAVQGLYGTDPTQDTRVAHTSAVFSWSLITTRTCCRVPILCAMSNETKQNSLTMIQSIQNGHLGPCLTQTSKTTPRIFQAVCPQKSCVQPQNLSHTNSKYFPPKQRACSSKRVKHPRNGIVEDRLLENTRLRDVHIALRRYQARDKAAARTIAECLSATAYLVLRSDTQERTQN